MNGSTKILTVSYGTFSCTLEEFDDPLGSMRDIAEYFRDLAADDRYFGAEPPTPDVEMLQNIAQKEVQRRVEARVSDTGIALVASDEAVAPVAPASAVKDDRVVETDDDTKGPLTFDDEFLMSDEPEDVLAVDPDATADVSGPAESVAEKLRRIRAVVSKSIEAEAEESSNFSADPAQIAGEDRKRDRALTRTIEQITADLSDDEDAQNDLEDEGASEDAPIEDAIELEVDATDADAEEHSEPDDAAEIESSGADGDRSDISEMAPQELYGSDEHVADELVEDYETDDESEFSDQQLARTVSDVLGKISAAEEIEDDPEDVAVSPRPTTRAIAPEPEIDVGRLLDETDTKLNEDDTVRRRRVISQMRAAVAATKADRLVSRQVSREDAEEAEKDPYREDLSEAVQDTERPAPARKSASTTPLMLVSSQRIDADNTPTEPSSVESTVQGDAPASFAEFAESVGAKELHELLEAAAAYTVFAEGQSSFTRPEIMKRVAHFDRTVPLSREDGLRSFGQLLREGKFKKLERGQFTVDETTKYHPEHRFAGE